MRTIAMPPSRALETYDQMAPFYDELTAHHDYGLYLASLMPMLKDHGLNGKRLLDLGCGTGKSFIPLLNEGWKITGCDISAAMLVQAQRKASSARFELADIRALPHLGSFDLVWSLGDALNYLLSREELEAAFSGMRKNLAPQGLLLFDLNTALTYRTFYAEDRTDDCCGRRLAWRGGVDQSWEEGDLAAATMSVEDPDGGTCEAVFEHRQRHFCPEEVLATLRRSGLEPLALYGFGFDAVLQQPLDEYEHTKALFVASSA